MITSSRAFSIARYLLLAAVAVLLTPSMWAQMPVSSSTTSTPVPGAGHDYIGEFNETVNPGNGSLSIRISPTMPPGRGLTLPFSFAYDSTGVNYVTRLDNGNFGVWNFPSTTIVSAGGWSESAPVVSANELTWTAHGNEGGNFHCIGFVNYVYQDPSGNRHNLNLTNYTAANNQNDACTYDTIDWPLGFSGDSVTQGGEDNWTPLAGGIIASIPPGGVGVTVGPVTVTQPDGTVLGFPNTTNRDSFGSMATSVEDRNGNMIQITPPPGFTGGYSYTDTLGRALLTESGFTSSSEHVTILGYNADYILSWEQLGAPTFSDSITCIWAPLGVCPTSFGHLWQSPLPGSGPIYAVSQIELPNQEFFKFTYDPIYGVITQINYPTGGYVSYVWGMNSQAEYGWSVNPKDSYSLLYAVPVIAKRSVSFDGKTIALQQTYSYSTNWTTNSNNGTAYWTTKNTIVTTIDNARNTSYATIYTYSPSGALTPPNTSAAPTNWDPVEQSIQYCADASVTTGTNPQCAHAPLKTVYKAWTNPRLLASQETQYPSGQANKTTWSYNSREQQTEQDDYDFGTTGVGPLLRKTITNYQAFNDTPLYSNAPSIVDRACQVITYDSTGTNRVAETDYFYDNGATTTPCGTAGTPSVAGAGGSSLTGHDETNYSAGSTYPRGNLTQKTQWLNTGSSSPATTYSYDETGQVLSMTDPCGNGTCSDMSGSSHTTTYSYTDSFLNTNSNGYTTTAGSPPSGKVTNAYLTQITEPTTNGVAHVEKFSYGYNDGELTQSSDQNSPPNLTKYKYNDSLGRQTETDYPDTGQTTVSYNDSIPSVTTTKLISSSVSLSTTSVMDGLGHVTQTQLTTDPDGPTYTATVYDGNGRSYQVYNPTRCSPPTTNCGTETTWGLTTYTYDALGRTTQVAKPDGSIALTSYSANQTTVTDEVGNQRTNQTDGAGRLTNVWEAPNITGYNFQTVYAYDPLNNLVSVNQTGGSRTRTFTYDSLSRLVCAANPEVQIVTCPTSATGTFPRGAITYTYDLDGNVLTKVEPEANQTGTTVTTHNYTYDALNRLIQDTHVNPQQGKDVYGYDGIAPTGCPGPTPPTLTGATNLIGRRSAMCQSLSASSFSYDPVGRMQTERRNNKGSGTNATNLQVGYTYWKDGSLNTLTYPSGDVITYAVGGAGRATQVSDPSTNFVGYSGNTATYAPTGALATMTNGYNSSPLFVGIATSNLYNVRLQPMLLSASVSSSAIFSLCYDFHLGVAISKTPCSFSAYATGDNGNVFQVVNHADTTRSAAYIYDPLNRIAQAYTTNINSAKCWGETYSATPTAPGVLPSTLGIDAWGNLLNRSGVSGMAGNCKTEGLSATATGQNQLFGIGVGYDAAGNVTNDGSGNTPTYDAENRIATDAGYTYSYDADGVRMEKTNGSTGTMYWPGPFGALTETNLAGTINEEYVYFNGLRIARIDRPGGTVHYYFSNHLGSHTMVTNATGTCEQDIDYYPYGGVIADYCPVVAQHYKFTGKERDSESGLDNFGARYNASSMGRFMSPDPSNASVDFWIPQTWNRYAYALNNPLQFVDRNGLWPTSIHTEIITNAFPGLSQGDRTELIEASYDTDYTNRVNGHDPQDPEVSFVHGMSDGVHNQDPAEAQAEGDAFIAQNEHDAQQIQAEWVAEGNTGIAPAALTAFGNALHTIEDRTSPAHVGNQPWYGTKGIKNKYRALQHVRREATINSAQMRASVAAAQQAFRQTFGDEFEWLAIQQRPKACVEVDDGLGNHSKSCD